MSHDLRALSLGELQAHHPEIRRLLALADPTGTKPGSSLGSWLETLDPIRLSEVGLDADQLTAQIDAIVQDTIAPGSSPQELLNSLTLIGGADKAGKRETLELEIRVGEILCIVGPTGSGKSRLLADIECLAQADTPSGRTILVNRKAPDPSMRFGSNSKLIAQLSQNMNFVVDLSAREFLTMHAACRMVGTSDSDALVAEVISCANELAGERFDPDTPVTQLSGGQSRALMIADIALLSASPIVLIDEIENAGIDRGKALRLLVSHEKIVLISTHDPILALMGSKRIVIRNGAVADVIATSYLERACLEELQRMDARFVDVRRRLRTGKRIDDVGHEWSCTL
jgi:ABC-type lipoprotein export system ATPase subunit